MNKSIEVIRQTRLSVLNLVQDLSIEQLNKVPSGFNNNIAWNLGHMIAAQQGICYKRAGLNTVVDQQFFDTYKPDTKPERLITIAEIETIRQLMFSTLDQLEADYKRHIFTSFQSFVTRYGVKLNSIEEVIEFLPFHEGLHMGYIMALKRAI